MCLILAMWLLYLYVWMFRTSVGLFNAFVHQVASGYVCVYVYHLFVKTNCYYSNNINHIHANMHAIIQSMHHITVYIVWHLEWYYF